MSNHAIPDKGETLRFNKVMDSNWECDEEPLSAANDVHARFALTEKLKIKST